MRRKADIEAAWQHANVMAHSYPLSDPQVGFWVGVRDALGWVLNTSLRLPFSPLATAVPEPEARVAPSEPEKWKWTGKRGPLLGNKNRDA